MKLVDFYFFWKKNLQLGGGRVALNSYFNFFYGGVVYFIEKIVK
jgi:hypothetical protein